MYTAKKKNRARNKTPIKINPVITRSALALASVAILCISISLNGNQGSIEQKLENWIVSDGSGMSLLATGHTCTNNICHRGAFATRNIKKGEMVMSIPLTKSIRLQNAPSYMEKAYHLLIQTHISPEFNSTHPFFWKSMPTPDEVLDLSLLSDEQLIETQCQKIIDTGRNFRAMAESLYSGSYRQSAENDQPYQPLSEILPSKDFSLRTLLYVASLVRSRYFNAIIWQGGRQVTVPYLIPIMDMINHHTDSYLVSISNPQCNGTHMELHALRDIKKGEEVFWNYHPGFYNRNDHVFQSYGFLLEQDPPLLFAMDLPNYESLSQQINFPDNDGEYYGPLGKHNTLEEYKRLENILKAMPTSVEHDESLLINRGAMHWNDEMIIRFRLVRKKALQHAMDTISRHF